MFKLQGLDEVLTYDFDFAEWVNADVAVVSFQAQSVPSGPTVNTGAIDGAICPVEVAGLTFGQTYRIEVAATLSSGSIVTKTLVIRCGAP